jgi:hypothetical protein
MHALAALLAGTVVPRQGRRPFVVSLAVTALLMFGTVQPTTPAAQGQARGGRAATQRASTSSRFDLCHPELERPGTSDTMSVAPASDPARIATTPLTPQSAVLYWAAASADPPEGVASLLLPPFAPSLVSRSIAPSAGRAPPLS